MQIPNWLHRRLLKLRDRTVAKRDPDFIIGEHYMHRWWVIPRNGFFNIYLHHFLKSDDDRALHDHPWWNVSLLLEGEYTEHTIPAGGVNVRTVRGARAVKFRGAKSAHRVELHAGPCWTLFITGPRIRDWGFHCPQRGWVGWREFTAAGEGRRGEIAK